MATLERRVAVLEQANRRWRFAAGLLGMLLLLALTVGAEKPAEVLEVLRTKRLEVLRPDGTVAIELRADDKQTWLSLGGPRNSERNIALGADEEGVYLMLMKNKEAPLFMAAADDNGARLHLLDGREPSQGPNGIMLGSVCSDEMPHGRAILSFLRGSALKSAEEAGFHMEGPSQGTFLLLGGPNRQKVKVQVEQDSGKVQFLDENDKLVWSTP